MSQEQESPSQLSGLFGPTLILAIGGLVAYFTIEPSLQSQRPDLAKRRLVPPPPSVKDLNAVHSRLWDDPLAVAYDDSQRRHHDSTTFSQLLDSLVKKDDGSSSDETDALSSDETNVQRYFKRIANQFLRRRDGKGRFLCMPVLVPGEPYDNDTEDRKRITYALLSALAACGYELSVPDRVSYVELPVIVHIPSIDETVRLDRFVVPVKLFQHTDLLDSIPKSDGPDGVLVLWVNENQLGHRPLAAIGQVLEGLFGTLNATSGNKVDVRILGPVDSDTLLEMAQEDAKWDPKPSTPAMSHAYSTATESRYFSKTYGTDENDPKLYSGRATISAHVLDNEMESGSHQSVLMDFTSGNLTNSGLSVVRTIGSDWQLAKLLAHELKLRDAWPLRDDPVRGPDSIREQPVRHVVLVTESDSLYGRALPAVFRTEFPNLTKSSHPARQDDQDLLHVFTYLRGLDGKVPGDSKESMASQTDAKKAGDSDSDPLHMQNPETIPASGRSQFDYLRRLEQQLVEIDQASRDDGQQGIVAIGVVGTDIYDKLLVLRALRKRFPRTWFFSTDLDAALSLPSEYPTSRNLIVASHFGLTLNPRLQRLALPFRDVYQTATYFSTLLALDDDATRRAISESPDPWELQNKAEGAVMEAGGLNPLVFEIARSGPYQLSIPELEPSQTGKNVHPAGPRERHWLYDAWNVAGLVGLILLAGAGVCCLSEQARDATRVICCGWRRRDWNRERIVLCSAVMLLTVLFLTLLGAAVADHMNPSGEPFVLFEGISIWPPTIVRFFVLVLSASFVTKAVHDVRRYLGPKLRTFCETIPGSGAAPSVCGKILDGFCEGAAVRLYLTWSFVPAVGLLIFCGLLLMISERPPSPFRGPVAERLQSLVLRLAVPAMMYLTCLVIAHVEYCRRFVLKLGGSRADWQSEEMEKLDNDRQPFDRADLGELLSVQIIAESTEAVGKLVKYPFIVLFVMILSQHPALDKLEFPWSLVAIWVLIVALLSWTAHAMRRDARSARDEVLGRLRDALSFARNAKIHPSNAARRIDQLQQYIAEIEAEDRGAFQALMQDPLIQALALGTSGGLMLIHQLLPYV